MNDESKFSKNDIEQCKHILRVVELLDENQVNPEAIMRMCIFCATTIAMHEQMTSNDFRNILKDTWDAMQSALDEIEVETWVSDKPISDDEQ